MKKIFYLILLLSVISAQQIRVDAVKNKLQKLWDQYVSKAAQDCSDYQQNTYGQCSVCGSCFNGAARRGKMCPQSSGAVGYFCPDENLFACIDWTFGSKRMVAAETSFNAKYGDNVYFGVGTYGSTDAMLGIGTCLRMKVKGVDRDLILQSINTGGDVDGNQFDLQVGDGGFGAFNWCAGADFSIYPGDKSQWGDMYGGWKTRDGCKKLPKYPKIVNPAIEYDNLIDLCEYSFDKKVRGSNGENPTIVDLARVECPSELYEFTQLKRTDDPSGFTFEKGQRQPGFPNTSVSCGQSGLTYCLTRMMDCKKPSGGYKDNIKPSLVKDGMKLVQPCSNDGYTRMDVKCGCYDCYC